MFLVEEFADEIHHHFDELGCIGLLLLALDQSKRWNTSMLIAVNRVNQSELTIYRLLINCVTDKLRSKFLITLHTKYPLKL